MRNWNCKNNLGIKLISIWNQHACKKKKKSKIHILHKTKLNSFPWKIWLEFWVKRNLGKKLFHFLEQCDRIHVPNSTPYWLQHNFFLELAWFVMSFSLIFWTYFMLVCSFLVDLDVETSHIIKIKVCAWSYNKWLQSLISNPKRIMNWNVLRDPCICCLKTTYASCCVNQLVHHLCLDIEYIYLYISEKDFTMTRARITSMSYIELFFFLNPIINTFIHISSRRKCWWRWKISITSKI